MIEVDIHDILTEGSPKRYSASQAELGTLAGPITWNNAVEAAKGAPMLTGGQLASAKDYFRGYGAWEDDEIDAWTVAEVDALVIQEAAHEYRTLTDLAPGDGIGGIDWDEANRLSERGDVCGRLFVHADRMHIQLSE